MGYVKNVEIIAYLTQKGKDYIVSGKKKHALITHFSIADPDTNYVIASSTTYNTIGEKNILKKDFIPNISGVYGSEDNCLKYLSNNIIQKYSLFGGCDRGVGEFILSTNETDLNYLEVSCIKPEPILLLIETENYNSFDITTPPFNKNAIISDYTIDKNINNDVIDYVYKNLSLRNGIGFFDINIRYKLLNMDTTLPLYKTNPKGNETFNVKFNYFDSNILKEKYLIDPLNYNPNNSLLKFNNEDNLFILDSKEDLTQNKSGSILYISHIKTADILNLPNYGWNIVADFDVITYNNLDGATYEINRPQEPLNSTINKKIRFYNPTKVGIKHTNPLAQNDTLELTLIKRPDNKYNVKVPHNIYLNNKSPEGLENVELVLKSSSIGIKNLHFSNKNNESFETYNFKKDDVEFISQYEDISFEIDETLLVADQLYLLDFAISINNTNDYVITDSKHKIIYVRFIYRKSNPNFTLTLDTNIGSSVITNTGSGTYKQNTQVPITTSSNDNQYTFNYWSDENGNKISTSKDFNFIITKDTKLTANYTYKALEKNLFIITYFGSFYDPNQKITNPNTNIYYKIPPINKITEEKPYYSTDVLGFTGNATNTGFNNMTSDKNLTNNANNYAITKGIVFEEPFYLKIQDGVNKLAVLYYGEPSDYIIERNTNPILVVNLYGKKMIGGKLDSEKLIATYKSPIKDLNGINIPIENNGYDIDIQKDEEYRVTVSSENGTIYMAEDIYGRRRGQIALSVAST
jgi:hypothetical protein